MIIWPRCKPVVGNFHPQTRQFGNKVSPALGTSPTSFQRRLYDDDLVGCRDRLAEFIYLIEAGGGMRICGAKRDEDGGRRRGVH